MRPFFISLCGVVLFLGLLSTTTAFLVSNQAITSGSKLYAAPSGYATTREGKNERIENYKKWLDGTQFVFAVPSTELTVKQVKELKNAMPEGTDIHVVKNTLIRRAIEETQWEVLSPKLEGPAMWFFVKDDLP